jgi:demethylmenaquinone methyltransferase/2-methoxy-6-polyprenyl-1,4-benzoquinol methylase
MFTRIAGRYDLMNSLMTAGRHHAWRLVAARACVAAPPGPILDLATGTADLALAIHALDPSRVVVGADFSEGMLTRARPKLAPGRGRATPGDAPPTRSGGEVGGRPGRVVLAAADALALPFRDGTFACVTSAFLLRNLEDLERGLGEMRRVTTPGGRVVSLDIVRPAVPVWDRLFGAYFHRVVPAIGALVAGDRVAYTYLPSSVAAFVTPRQLAGLMARAGLGEVRWRTLGLGTIALHVAAV